MDLRCELRNSKCCIYLPGVPQTERKGRKVRSESARRAGLRILGPVQKTGMVNVHLVVHKHFSSMAERSISDDIKSVRFRQMQPSCSQRVYGFRKENQLIVLQYEHV